MKIELKEISIREVVDGYMDNSEGGVVGYNGKLNIRPPYQREFVYKDEQRNAVIETVIKKFPLNIMYWVKNSNDTYELLDGQQRTISICQYIDGEFSVNDMFFHNLTKEEKDKILNYNLMVYFCEGTDREKLDWFKVINTVGEKLTPQEIKNAVYSGEWVTAAKKIFSKTGCPAHDIAENYLKGSAIRQDYLETAIRWISSKDNIEIEDYMSKHQHDSNASEIWVYFQSVIDWVERTFPREKDKKPRKDMKGIEWGILYNKYKDNKYDPIALEKRIVELIEDDEVTKKSGIYKFLLSGEKDDSSLNLRDFDDKVVKKVYERQKGICPMCNSDKCLELGEMEADHIIPWSKGGKSVEENCQMLCMHHNRTKSDK